MIIELPLVYAKCTRNSGEYFLLCFNSLTKNYAIQNDKLQLYIQILKFSCLIQNSLKLTWINLVHPLLILGRKFWEINMTELRERERERERIAYYKGALVFKIYKNLEVLAKIHSQALSCRVLSACLTRPCSPLTLVVPPQPCQ